jgi:hypothetical protein
MTGNVMKEDGIASNFNDLMGKTKDGKIQQNSFLEGFFIFIFGISQIL